MRFEAGASWRILVLIFFLCFRLEERNNGIRYVNTYHLVIVSTVANQIFFVFFGRANVLEWNGDPCADGAASGKVFECRGCEDS